MTVIQIFRARVDPSTLPDPQMIAAWLGNLKPREYVPQWVNMNGEFAPVLHYRVPALWFAAHAIRHYALTDGIEYEPGAATSPAAGVDQGRWF